jgi:LmbE family N-acetylglucosaminyl deacetylase
MSPHHDAPPAGVDPLVVVAHPDDEILWFEPWLSDTGEVLVALPTHPRDDAITRARHEIRDHWPVGDMTFLPLRSVDVIGRSDWRRREPTDYGVTLAADCPGAAATEYVANHARLVDELREPVASRGVVVTHNPWGEYGHEEHIQVCHAVLTAAAAAGADVWAWDGLPQARLAASSMRLRQDYYEPRTASLPRVTRPSDLARYRRLKQMYFDRGAWTYYEDYEPPQQSTYIQLMRAGEILLPPVAPHPVARNAGIVAGHVRRAPTVLRRVISRGRLRAR